MHGEHRFKREECAFHVPRAGASPAILKTCTGISVARGRGAADYQVADYTPLSDYQGGGFRSSHLRGPGT